MKLDRDLVASLNASSPPWMVAARERAFEIFSKLEMPTSSEEVWRYLDLGFDIDAFEVAGPGEPLTGPDALGEALGSETSLVIVDGEIVHHTEAAGAHGPAQQSMLARTFERGTAQDIDVFSAAHHAFLRDVAFVDVTTEGQGVRYVDVQATAAGVSFPHVSIAAAENTDVSVVVGMRSPDGIEPLVVPAFDIDLDAGARGKVTIVQQFGERTRSIAHLRARLGRDASLVVAEAGLGARLSRLHMTIDLEGPGAAVQVLGLYFGDRDQVLDYRAFINHLARSTTSEMLLKGAVEDTARSVFSGLIKIERNAGRAHAFQTNKNLVLSEGAQAQSVPNLEILTDDVMCGHASTSGPLDEEHLYYLRSRGLPGSRAERLLIRGFFEEVLRRLPEAAAAEPIRAEVARKFVQAQSEGRL